METKTITSTVKVDYRVHLRMAYHVAKEMPSVSDCTQKWMTVSQVADMLQLSEDYVRSLIQNGHIKALKLPGSRNAPVRVGEDDILEFLESCNIDGQHGFKIKIKPSARKHTQRRRRRSVSADSWGV